MTRDLKILCFGKKKKKVIVFLMLESRVANEINFLRKILGSGWGSKKQ